MRVLLPDIEWVSLASRVPNASLYVATNQDAFVRTWHLSPQEAELLILFRIVYQGWYGVAEVT